MFYRFEDHHHVVIPYTVIADNEAEATKKAFKKVHLREVYAEHCYNSKIEKTVLVHPYETEVFEKKKLANIVNSDELFYPCVLNDQGCLINKRVGEGMTRFQAEDFLKTHYRKEWNAAIAIPKPGR